MTCKQIRAAQLDNLKDGIATAFYTMIEAHHDGRIIRRKQYDTREEVERAAAEERKKCEPYTHILVYATFQI